MILQTQRLILRPWQEADAADLYQYAKDPRVGPIAGWQPHTSVEESRLIIRTVLAPPETYALVLRETGQAVGSASIMKPRSGSAPMGESEAEIGYWIGVPFWGQGLVPEAVERLLRRCFEDLGCTGVWCGYYDGNHQSKRVQEKCGFLYHHSSGLEPSPLGDLRVEHFSYLSRERYIFLHPDHRSG